MTGKLKTRGNMMLATKLNEVLKVGLVCLLISFAEHSCGSRLPRDRRRNFELPILLDLDTVIVLYLAFNM